MKDPNSEINFSTSSLKDPRLGARFVKNYDKLSIDISGEIKNAKEIPYGNDDDELFWFVAETLYLTEDLFEQVQLNKNHISSNIYYRLDNEN